MWSTSKDRSTLSQVPSLPAINDGYHRNGPTSPTPYSHSVEKRMANLELSNKALLEEMMQVHVALRREREHTSRSLSCSTQETNKRLSHTQSLWESSSEELVSQNRRMADRLARLERAVSGMGGAVSRLTADRENEEAWLKENFSDVHEHVSWLNKKVEGTFAELSNSLKCLEDSTAVKHRQLVAMVTSGIEKRETPLKERVGILENTFIESQKSLSESIKKENDDLFSSIEQMKKELNNLNESLSVNREKHKAQFGSLKESLSKVTKETSANYQELSTVLKAEIKQRLRVFSDVRAQCSQIQGLCRGSVQTLREGLLSLEERMAALRKEVHTGHEQAMIYCQEISRRLHTDLEMQLTLLHQQLVSMVTPPVAPSGTFLETINEDADNKHSEDTDHKQHEEDPELPSKLSVATEVLGGVTTERSEQILKQSKVLLESSKELQQENCKRVGEQVQLNLKQSELLAEQCKQVQSNLNQAQEVLFQAHTRSHLDGSKLVLSQVQVKFDQSKEVFDHIETALCQSEQVLDQLRPQLDQTKTGTDQIQSSLNHSRQVLNRLQSTLTESKQMLEEVNSSLSERFPEQRESPVSEAKPGQLYEGNDFASRMDTVVQSDHANRLGGQLLSDKSRTSTATDRKVIHNNNSESVNREQSLDLQTDDRSDLDKANESEPGNVGSETNHKPSDTEFLRRTLSHPDINTADDEDKQAPLSRSPVDFDPVVPDSNSVTEVGNNEGGLPNHRVGPSSGQGDDLVGDSSS